MRPLLSITFPQGFRISRNTGHPTLGSGGKKTVKRYLKSEHTDRQTNKYMDISTHRKHRPRGLAYHPDEIDSREAEHIEHEIFYSFKYIADSR